MRCHELERIKRGSKIWGKKIQSITHDLPSMQPRGTKFLWQECWNRCYNVTGLSDNI